MFIPWGQRCLWEQPATAGLPSGDNLGRARNAKPRQAARQEFSPSREQQQNQSKDWWDLDQVEFTAGQELPLSSERRKPETGGGEQAGFKCGVPAPCAR